MASSFRESSLKLNKELSTEDRKNQGIYFTPKKARDLLFEQLDILHVKPKSILEPSFGSGEFLEDVREKYGGKITGIELNTTLFNAYTKKDMELKNMDFLQYKGKKFDLILGNPPYFLTKDKNPKCMVGRPNIYIAFLYKCLEEHLVDKGFLAFILPTSLFNCSYYEPMRKYIADHYTIHYVKELDVKYYETLQDTMLIILQKQKDPEEKYIFRKKNVYISPMYKELKELVKNTTTIGELDLHVKTGSIVWNQEKEKLVDKSDDATLLIYTTNIVKGELVLNNIRSEEKKQYIKGFKTEPQKGKAILVNRGYGNVSYKFHYVYIDKEEFYAENHVNMILPNNEENSSEKNLDNLNTVLKSFKDPRTLEFLKYFLGNGAMSKSEIEHIMPIYLV